MLVNQCQAYAKLFAGNFQDALSRDKRDFFVVCRQFVLTKESKKEMRLAENICICRSMILFIKTDAFATFADGGTSSKLHLGAYIPCVYTCFELRLDTPKSR